MNKKLLAVAVAGALAAPGLAFAQASTVTIDGVFKMGLESLSMGDATTSGTSTPGSRLNTSQMRMVDGSSAIHFNIVEGLGNGLSAVAKLDLRFTPDAGGLSNSGNTWVGLSSKTLGTLTFGRWDLHYGKTGGDEVATAAALEAWNVALMDYIQVNGGTGVSATGVPNANNIAVANATRTPNVVKWDSPNWNGFTGTIAWSANPLGNTIAGNGAQEADMLSSKDAAALDAAVAAGTASRRKGDGWNVNPRYANGPFTVGYSYWRARPDAPVFGGTPTSVSLDQRGDAIYGFYTVGGFKVGLGWNKSRLNLSTGTAGLSGAKVAERTAWSIPMTYTWGPHTVLGHYTKAGNISADAIVGNTTDNTGARMVSVAYVYSLSKRTSVGLTYARIDNDSNASYNFFTSGALGSTDAGSAIAGESPRLLQATVRHAF